MSEILKVKADAYEQLKIIVDSLNGYNTEVAINGLKTRIEMTEKQMQNILN